MTIQSWIETFLGSTIELLVIYIFKYVFLGFGVNFYLFGLVFF